MMISEVFIRRPKLSFVISIVTVLGGLLCLTGMPIAEYPEIAPPSIMVIANYPGAGSQVITDTVASVIESEVNGVEDVIYFSSQSDNSGSYMLTLTFESGTDTDIALVNVQNAVRRAEPSLPAEVVDLGIKVIKRSSDILAMYAFTATDPSISQLYLNNFVRMHVRDAMARIPGVSQAQIFGTKDYSMRVWLDTMRMTALNLRPDDVAAAIRAQNVQAAAGTVGAENSNDFVQLKVNTLGRLNRVEDFENIVVKVGENGALTRLRDIARIELGSDYYDAESAFNGYPSVAMALYRSSDANAIQVIDACNERLEELKKTFPAGIECKLGYDPTEYIRMTMSEIFWTLVLTLVLVVIITYLFLQDWRATLIPTLAIPVSLIGTFVVLAPLGYSINVLTMFGLILVIGSLVDDAIVVVENCVRIIEEEHLSPREAALKSMEQITGAIIATTLVILAVYAPIGFYGGMVGTIYLQFSVTMCVALLFSTINALTLSPALCSLLLKPYDPDKHDNPVFRPFNKVLDGSRLIYLGISRFMVRRIFLSLLVFAAAMAYCYYLHGKTPTSFLPEEDKGAILCDVELPPGATLGRTKKVTDDIFERVKKIPGVRDMIVVDGFSFIGGSGENVGLAIAALDNWDLRKDPDRAATAIHRKILAETAMIPDAKVNAFLPPAIMGLGATGGVSFKLEAIAGQTPQELSSTLNALIGKLMAEPETLYAFSTFNANTPQLYLDLDRSLAESMQVPVSRIFTTLQSKLASTYVNDFNLYGYSFKVKMQSEAEERSTMGDISQISIQSNTGKMVPLSALASLRHIVGPRTIERFDLFMSAGVTAMPKPGVSTGELMRKIEKVMETMPRGYKISWVDMSYQERGNEGKLGLLMALALLFGYLFLVAQYESWTIPLPVVLSTGVAMLGGYLGMQLWGLSMSIYSQLGLVMLVGLASKNAILIVEFSKQEREAGVPVVDAAMNGARARYRAVLMTAWSFIIGVLPLVFATGAGAGSRVDIGVVTFMGMVLATLIGICFVPVFYVFFQKNRERILQWRHRK